MLGTVLDGIPESIVIGISCSRAAAVSVAVIAAVFLSNLPEAIAATTGLAEAGWARRRILWPVVGGGARVRALVARRLRALRRGVAAGHSPSSSRSPAGAILTMLAETMMPEAYQHGGKLVGLATTLGFALAFAPHDAGMTA